MINAIGDTKNSTSAANWIDKTYEQSQAQQTTVLTSHCIDVFSAL